MATPTTVNTWPLNGSIQEFDVTFDYLSQTFIKVNLIGPTGLTLLTLGTDYTFVTPTRIRTVLVYGPPNFTTIEIRRETSTTERLVEFQDASILHAQDLNVDALQVMHVAEEARNAATETLGVNGDGNLDARNRRIVNVLDPVDPADVLTLNYYTSQLSGAHADRLAAEAARDKAQEWATKPTAVEGTDQSAKTYAAQAGSSASAASTSAGNAAGSASAASTSASNAAGSASAASGSAGAAATSASNASGSAIAASTSAGVATTQAGIATNQAGIATTKAAEAAASALSVDAAYLNGQLANNTVAQSVHGGQLAGTRNMFHNGSLIVWQRGQGPFSLVSGTAGCLADRWTVTRVGSGATNFQRDSDVPSGVQLVESMTFQATAAHTVGSSDAIAVSQSLEGYDARRLYGKTFTLSFWVKATRTGSYGVSLRSPTATRSYVLAYTINAANTWQKVTLTFTGGIPVDAAFNSWTNGRGVEVMFGVNVGTTFRSPSNGSWLTGNYIGPSTQAQGLVSNTDVFKLAGLQLELGTVATEFEHTIAAAEVLRCMRYYQRVAIGVICWAGAGTNIGSTVPLPVLLRDNPTITLVANAPYTPGNVGPRTTVSTNSYLNVYATAVVTGASQFTELYGLSAEI